MSDARPDDWAAQLEAALASMEPETDVQKRPAADEVHVTVDADDTRQMRAELSGALQRRGFTVLSTTDEDRIRVDATAEPLTHPFTERGSA